MKVIPSLLAADFAHLASEIQAIEHAGVDMLHIDVMDGHFVPNISMGPVVIEAVRPLTNSHLDVHLMIEQPEDYIQSFVEAGADSISVHQEACPHLHRVIQQIKAQGTKAGVALNPGTPIHTLKHVLHQIDFILIMTVNPGFGGQSFIEEMTDKIAETRDVIQAAGLTMPIEVDGGIKADTIGRCRDAGAEWFVAGSSVFGASDRERAVQMLMDTEKRH